MKLHKLISFCVLAVTALFLFAGCPGGGGESQSGSNIKSINPGEGNPPRHQGVQENSGNSGSSSESNDSDSSDSGGSGGGGGATSGIGG